MSLFIWTSVVLSCFFLLAESSFLGPTWSTTRLIFNLHSKIDDSNDNLLSRRSTLENLFRLGSFALPLVTIAKPSLSGAEVDDLTRGGVKVTPLNGLIFNYRGTAFQGLDASTLGEPSVPYADFLKALDEGNVKFVEFLAPSGNQAYVTFKSIEGVCTECSPIRIGEGYPIEDPQGYSSPAFAVKAVQKKNVPYKFTLPALIKYK